mgnify:CR=1 FL=1
MPFGMKCPLEAERRHRAEAGCGPLHAVRCVPGGLLAGARRAPLPPPDRFPELFRALYAAGERGQSTGGLHVAALSDGEALLYATEEVGRHNAVDKAIGAAFLAGAELPALGLVLSARVSGEIALKAARAGLAWVASRSVPTTLALEVARAAGLPLVARAPGKDARVYLPAGGAGEGAA